MKILIIGGTKFMGRQLVELLSSNESCEIYLFNRGLTNPEIFRRLNNVHQIRGDVKTTDVEKLASYNWDYIFDFNAIYPQSLIEIFKVISNSLTRIKYILISSISAYNLKNFDSLHKIGENYTLKSCDVEEYFDESIFTYGKRKAECEKIALANDSIDLVILRPSIVYGRYDWSDRLYYWIHRILNNSKFLIPDYGDHQLSLTYASDLVEFCNQIISKKIPNGVYNFSTHDPLSLKEILKLIGGCLGVNIDNLLIGVNQDKLIEDGFKMQSDLPLWFGGSLMLDNEKVRREVDFRFTDFEDSLLDTIGYYKSLNWPFPSIGLDEEKERDYIDRNY